MKVGDLLDALRRAEASYQRAHLDATLDQWRALDVVVRGWDDVDGNNFCGWLQHVDVEIGHDDDETPYLALDATNEDEDA